MVQPFRTAWNKLAPIPPDKEPGRINEERRTGASKKRPREASEPPPEGAGEPRSIPVLKVLYIFSGKKREADMRKALEEACKEAEIDFILEEQDLHLGGEDHNLLDATRRQKLLDRLHNTEFHVLIVTPPFYHALAGKI